MADGPTWTFRQLAGAKKTLLLSGWGAPFGRPRQGHVVRTPLKIRTERVRYPGGDQVTRHEFGTQCADWELKGRFRDRALGGTGTAAAKAQEVLSFVRDVQAVQITWGSYLTFTGFIEEFDPGYESVGEIEWVLRIQIDKDDTQARPPPPAAPTAPPLSAAAILDAMADVSSAVSLAGLLGGLFATLSTLLDVLSTAVGVLLVAAEATPSYDDATFAQLARLGSAVAGVRAAAIAVRETFAAITPGQASFSPRADDTIQLLLQQEKAEEQIRAMLSAATDIEDAAAAAFASRIQTTCVAADGDTWERISIRNYGSADRAGDLRDANEVPPGQAPVPGIEYLVPT
jgi:hypothetical protein